MTSLQTGHPRTVAPALEPGPHDIRGWTAADILLAVYAGTELWHSTNGDDPGDVLNDQQRELLDKAADVLAEEYYDVDPEHKTDPFRAWSPRSLAITLRAIGILWQDTGREDPADVLSAVQKERLDRAVLLVLTADDLARLSDAVPETGPGPLSPGEALAIVYGAIPEELRGGDVDRAMSVLNDFADRVISESESL